MREGWGWLFNSTKFHYFVDGRSLCGRWLKFTDGGLVPDDGMGLAGQDCKACYKALQKRKGVQDESDPKHHEGRLREKGGVAEAGKMAGGDPHEPTSHADVAGSPA